MQNYIAKIAESLDCSEALSMITSCSKPLELPIASDAVRRYFKVAKFNEQNYGVVHIVKSL